MVLLWKPPVYQGRDPVNGFYVDMKEAEAPEEAWRGINNNATEKAFLKVKNLKEAETYVFRVRAQNKAGVGKTSEATEPVSAVTRPGKDGVMIGGAGRSFQHSPASLRHQGSIRGGRRRRRRLPEL